VAAGFFLRIFLVVDKFDAAPYHCNHYRALHSITVMKGNHV